MSDTTYPTDLASMVEAQRANRSVPSQGMHPMLSKHIDGHVRAYLYVPRENDTDIPEFDCSFIPEGDMHLYEEHDSNRIQLMLIDQRRRMSKPVEDFCLVPYIQRKP